MLLDDEWYIVWFTTFLRGVLLPLLHSLFASVLEFVFLNELLALGFDDLRKRHLTLLSILGANQLVFIIHAGFVPSTHIT